MSQINWNIEFNTRGRRILCWVAGGVLLAASLFVWLAVDERLNCHIDNVIDGHFWPRNFARDVNVDASAPAFTVDLRHLRQFRSICIISMYAYGEPDLSPMPQLPIISAGRACWHDEPNLLTVLATDGNSHQWGRVRVGSDGYSFQIDGPNCAPAGRALLHCRREKPDRGVCRFAGALAG